MAKLNVRQEKFVELYCNGVPSIKAYDLAYETKGKKWACRQSASSRLLTAKPHVREAIEKRREEARQMAKLTREDNIKILEDIARNVDEQARDRIKAVEVLNQMLGFYSVRPKMQKVVVEVAQPKAVQAFDAEIVEPKMIGDKDVEVQ